MTSAQAVTSVLDVGLVPQVGLSSQQLGEKTAVFVFASHLDLEHANWLFDKTVWPHGSQPALLAVDVRGLRLEVDCGYEILLTDALEPARIRVLAPGEYGWDLAKNEYLSLGGWLARQ